MPFPPSPRSGTIYQSQTLIAKPLFDFKLERSPPHPRPCVHTHKSWSRFSSSRALATARDQLICPPLLLLPPLMPLPPPSLAVPAAAAAFSCWLSMPASPAPPPLLRLLASCPQGLHRRGGGQALEARVGAPRRREPNRELRSQRPRSCEAAAEDVRRAGRAAALRAPVWVFVN